MQYMGGKYLIRNEIADIINAHAKVKSTYWEPFMGACHVTALVKRFSMVYASDLHEDLVLLWQALQSGWQPPPELTEQEYNQLKKEPPSALRAFAGFACSFGGKFFRGYARSAGSQRLNNSYCDRGRRSLLRQIEHLRNVQFFRHDFVVDGTANLTFLAPLEQGDAVIYCDPPYAKTEGYPTGAFDHAAFWEKARRLSSLGNTVLVSEYSAPEDFACVWQKRTSLGFRAGRNNHKTGDRICRAEKLYSLAQNYHLPLPLPRLLQ